MNDESPERNRESQFARLLSAAREGSEQAISEVIEMYRPYLLKIANEGIDPELRRKIGASDVVQESLMTIHKCISDFRGETEVEFKAWLRTILVNDVMSVRRKFRGTAKRKLDREIGFHGDSQSSSPGIDPAKPGPTPRTEAAMSEEAMRLREALGRLPEEYQKVIQFRNWDQLSFEEIGEQLDRSAEASRKLWTRAVAKLQQELSGDDG